MYTAADQRQLTAVLALLIFMLVVHLTLLMFPGKLTGTRYARPFMKILLLKLRGTTVSQTPFTNWVVADVTAASNRILPFGTFNEYDWPLAVNVITVFVMSIIIVELPVPIEPGFRELLNQIYLPAGIEVELKLANCEVPLIVQFTIFTGFTVTTTFCVFVQPLAFNV